MKKKPLIIAHRGARTEAPENTLAAFDKAIKAGAHGVEFDIQFSADEKWVVFHDKNLTRLCGLPYQINKLKWSQIKKIEVGSWFSKMYKNEKIPSLEESLDLVQNMDWINIEIKSKKVKNQKSEENLIKLLNQYPKLKEKILISSFNVFSLLKIKKIDESYKRGYLYYEKQDPLSQKGYFAKWIKPYSMHPSLELLKKEKFKSIKKIQLQNKKTWVWTVNQIPDAELCVDEYGIDALITDEARTLVQHFYQDHKD